MPQIPVVLNTLVCYPLARFYRLGTGNEGHEVAFDDVFGICWIDPSRQGHRQVIGGEYLIILRRHDGFREWLRLEQGQKNSTFKPSTASRLLGRDHAADEERLVLPEFLPRGELLDLLKEGQRSKAVNRNECLGSFDRVVNKVVRWRTPEMCVVTLMIMPKGKF